MNYNEDRCTKCDDAAFDDGLCEYHLADRQHEHDAPLDPTQAGGLMTAIVTIESDFSMVAFHSGRFGAVDVIPVNDTASTFARIAGSRTLSDDTLESMDSLGVEFHIQHSPNAPQLRTGHATLQQVKEAIRSVKEDV